MDRPSERKPCAAPTSRAVALFAMLMAAAPAALAEGQQAGNHSLQITTPQPQENIWDWQLHYRLDAPLTKGAEYRMTMKIKGSSDGTLALWPIDTDSDNRNEWGGSNDVQYLASCTFSTEWSTVAWSFTADFPLNELDFVFGKFGGDLFFDDLSLTAAGSSDNLIVNPDFESELTAHWEKISYQNLSFRIVSASYRTDLADAIEAARKVLAEAAALTRAEAVAAREALTAVLAEAEAFESESDEDYLAEAVKVKNAAADLSQWIGVPDSADPNFQIYICFGQSNMEGNASPEPQDYENVPERFRVMAAVDMTDPKRERGEWYTATPPLCRQGTGLSPADYFGRTMVERQGAEVTVGVVHVAVGGTSIRGFMEEYVEDYVAGEADWFKSFMAAYDNNPFRRLVETARRAQNFGMIKGILMHQGETDNGNAEWPQMVRTVYERILAELSLKADNVPLLIGEMVRQDQGGCCWGQNANIAGMPGLIPTAHVISSEGCPCAGDALHFSAEGYRIIGRRYAEKMLEILSGRNGVEAAGADAPEPVAEECYDLCGRRLMAGAASRPAVYIRLLRYADGSVKRLKVRNVK